MPIVDPDTYETLSSATKSPEDYATGTEKKKLRAALDIASSQITKKALGFEAVNRMTLRRKLNKIGEQEIDKDYRDLIKALKKVLKSSEPLHSKGYDEDVEDETKAFIKSDLATLVECLKALG